MAERVLLVGADIPSRRVIYKATLPAGTSGKIREVALWANRSVQDGSSDDFITRADSSTELQWSNATWDTGSRANESTVRIVAPASTTVVSSPTSFSKNLSAYVVSDKILVAYEPLQNVASLRIDIGTDASNRFSYTISSPGTGYRIAAINKSSFTPVGNPDWSLATYLGVALTATSAGEGRVRLDAIRVNPQTNKDRGVLISRKVLSQEVTKERNAPLDIEFALDV